MARGRAPSTVGGRGVDRRRTCDRDVVVASRAMLRGGRDFSSTDGDRRCLLSIRVCSDSKRRMPFSLLSLSVKGVRLHRGYRYGARVLRTPRASRIFDTLALCGVRPWDCEESLIGTSKQFVNRPQDYVRKPNEGVEFSGSSWESCAAFSFVNRDHGCFHRRSADPPRKP